MSGMSMALGWTHNPTLGGSIPPPAPMHGLWRGSAGRESWPNIRICQIHKAGRCGYHRSGRSRVGNPASPCAWIIIIERRIEMSLPKFNEMSACPACGYLDKDTPAKMRSCSGQSMSGRIWAGTCMEVANYHHIHRYCARCDNEWLEERLDRTGDENR